MLKLFYLFLCKRLLGYYTQQTVIKLKLLVLFLLKLKPHFRDTINYSSILTLLIISLFLFNSCNTTEPEDINPEDVIIPGQWIP